MKLDLKDIILVPGAVLPFQFQLDLSDLEFGGQTPITHPVEVEGQVRNMAGALVLSAQAHTTLSLVCDRCGKPFEREKTVDYETLLAGAVGPYLSAELVAEMSAVGGLLIIGIAVNMLGRGKEKIKVGNMLPAIFLPIAYLPLREFLAGLF